MTAAAKAAQAELDNNTGAIAGAEKAMAEAPQRMKQEEAAIGKAKEAVGPAQATDQAAQAALAQKQAFLAEANALATKLWVETPKTPDDKPLAEAAAKARKTLSSRSRPMPEASESEIAASKADALATVNAAVATAEQTLARDKSDLDSYPKKIESWKLAAGCFARPRASQLARHARRSGHQGRGGCVKTKVDRSSMPSIRRRASRRD